MEIDYSDRRNSLISRERTYKPVKSKRIRQGRIREIVLTRDGYKCQKCGWKPSKSEEINLLHCHHLTYSEPDNPETCVTLCRECHVGKFTGVHSAYVVPEKMLRFRDKINDKYKLGEHWLDTVMKRLAYTGKVGDGMYLIEGSEEGDWYDEYLVEKVTTQFGETFWSCSCYSHRYGKHREFIICTHVGSALFNEGLEEFDENVKSMYKIRERREQFIEIGEELKNKFSRAKTKINRGVKLAEIVEYKGYGDNIYHYRVANNDVYLNMNYGHWICYCNRKGFLCEHVYAAKIARVYYFKYVKEKKRKLTYEELDEYYGIEKEATNI